MRCSMSLARSSRSGPDLNDAMVDRLTEIVTVAEAKIVISRCAMFPLVKYSYLDSNCLFHLNALTNVRLFKYMAAISLENVSSPHSIC